MSEPLQVRVSREGKEVGVYSAGEAVRLLRDGVLLRTDHYWHKGMKAWCLLPELVADPEIPPPMPIPESLPSEQTFFVRLGWVVSAPFVLALFGIPLACGFIHGIDFYKERQPSLFSLVDRVDAFFRHAFLDLFRPANSNFSSYARSAFFLD